MVDGLPEWITCGEAERLVNAITAGNRDHQRAFCSLLDLARIGHVAVQATTAEFWETRDFSSDTEWGPIALGAGVPFSPADLFFEELSRRYSDTSRTSGECSFVTGRFSFMHRRAAGAGDPDQREWMVFYNVVGLQFCRANLVAHFGSPQSGVAGTSPAQAAPLVDRGRPTGTGFEKADQPLIEEILTLMSGPNASSATAAAEAVAHRAQGNGTWDSKVKRLVRRVKALENKGAN